MARTPREKPNQLTASWPDVASPDPVGEVARQFVLNLVRAVGERSIRSVARDGGVDEGTSGTFSRAIRGRVADYRPR